MDRTSPSEGETWLFESARGHMKKTILIIIVAVLVVAGLAVFLVVNYFPKQPGGENKGQGLWQDFKWEIIKFKYPPDGQVDKVYYRTSAQEVAGEPEILVGLIIHEKGTSSTTQDVILVGGVQANCQTMDAPRCSTYFNMPFYTYSTNPQVITVFEALLKTVGYDNPGSAFIINFPKREEELEVGLKYVIRWDIKPGSNIPAVRIIAFSTLEYWKEGLILAVDNVPNIGSYEWIVPASTQPAAPYLIEISSCEYTVSTSSCATRDTWSQPFYIQ